jgi:hypothetical protein
MIPARHLVKTPTTFEGLRLGTVVVDTAPSVPCVLTKELSRATCYTIWVSQDIARLGGTMLADIWALARICVH